MTEAGRAIAPFVLAVASGVAVLISHPPVGAWPATFIAPALLVAALLLDRRRHTTRPRRRAFAIGAAMGIATFAPMLSWLILAAGFVGWVLLAAIQAAWFGLLAVLIRPWLGRTNLLPVVVAIAWTGIDAWRSLVPFNGFGWGALSYAHVDGSWMLPVARLAGGRAITFLVVLVSVAALVAVVRTWQVVAARDGAPVEAGLEVTRIPLALLVGGLLVSVLATIEPPAESGSLDVLVVQGNDVRHWEEPQGPDAPLRITTILRDRTIAAVERDGQPDLTIWPESSIDRDPYAPRGAELAELADEAAAAAGTLIAGASLDGADPRSERLVAALLLEDGFNETDRYVKRRLVPFGEYIPLRPLFDWFPPLEQVPRDAQPGEGPQTLSVADGVEVAVIICFETLFTEVTRSNVMAGDDPAELLVVATNDASFGDSAEPAQHLAQTRMLAVETGRWAVHGALSGSSAFVDPHGRAYQETELFTQDDIRHDVPLVSGTTPYLVVGDVVGTLTRVAAALLLLLIVAPSLGTRVGLRTHVAPGSRMSADDR